VSLQEFQQQIMQAVLAEESPRLPELHGDARADAATRMAIYRNGYRVRLRDSLRTEFAGLGHLMGRRFNAMLESYIEAHPSMHYNIRWHGAGVAAFLGYSRPWQTSPELAEMASLDWAISTTFDAANEPVLAAADLIHVPADAWANLRLRPQNHLQILSVQHNVDAFRRAADSNSKRPRLRRHAKVCHLLVWRHSLTVRYRTVNTDELSALTGAIKEESFAALCERLCEFHEPADALPRMASLLHQWLADGLICSWSMQ